ncbi:hypothetical protein [Agromyces larvae]|uniref:DUF4760 domain-containing protein n=1 Tax=Agromyces larvae TaxID=2929802 RepID=A0ABY4C009_9MICO|nr:hypothetical protein [Agromyces larvae]UOE44828.1 hypothetical protein MTO99_03315 [Agromyces larvae]
MSTELVYIAAALLGAVVGGFITMGVSARSARRERRARYGEALLSALNAAHRTIVARLAHPAAGGGAHPAARDEALAIWIQTELAATMELPRGRRSMQQWGAQFYEWLSDTADDDLAWLDHRLDLGTYLVIAWIAGYAKGRDFALSADEVEGRFAPRFRQGDFAEAIARERPEQPDRRDRPDRRER